jgi:hypothetical protein
MKKPDIKDYVNNIDNYQGMTILGYLKAVEEYTQFLESHKNMKHITFKEAWVVTTELDILHCHARELQSTDFGVNDSNCSHHMTILYNGILYTNRFDHDKVFRSKQDAESYRKQQLDQEIKDLESRIQYSKNRIKKLKKI